MKKPLCVLIAGVWFGTSACGKLATLAGKNRPKPLFWALCVVWGLKSDTRES